MLFCEEAAADSLELRGDSAQKKTARSIKDRAAMRTIAGTRAYAGTFSKRRISK